MYPGTRTVLRILKYSNKETFLRVLLRYKWCTVV